MSSPSDPPVQPRPPHRVVLHVGAPKSGTTFLQRTLWHHHTALREQGFLVPGDTHVEMFHAAIEVRGTYQFWGVDPDELRGTWAKLCGQARSFSGTTIMSHELLAAADDEQAAWAMNQLEGVDVHVVFTARDLGRQVLSEWQERVKNGSTQTFAQYQGRLTRQLRRGEHRDLFWRQQHFGEILTRWGQELPEENLHLVVSPKSGAAPDELWRRFSAAAGIDPDAFPPPPQKDAANQTLGAAEVSLLRRVNESLDGRIPQPHYARVVKRRFAQRILAAHRSERAACPPALLADLQKISREWSGEILETGIQVHGDLADLMPDSPDPSRVTPDEVDPADEAKTAAAVIADLLVERAQQPARLGRRPSTEQITGRQAVAAVRRRVRARLRRLGRRLRGRGSESARSEAARSEAAR